MFYIQHINQNYQKYNVGVNQEKIYLTKNMNYDKNIIS